MMRFHTSFFIVLNVCLQMSAHGQKMAVTDAKAQKPVPLFDGRSFAGWEGDTLHTWKIIDGMIAGGSLKDTVPHNAFLATAKPYKDFVLKVQFKLMGSEGFINSGVQFHSMRTTDPPYEMSGYQADLGNTYWASLYDESRRNRTLVSPDSGIIKKYLKPNEWNDYEVSCKNGRIRIRLNGAETVDYTEADPAIPQSGLIALQIHGGGKAQVFFKNIIIQEFR